MKYCIILCFALVYFFAYQQVTSFQLYSWQDNVYKQTNTHIYNKIVFSQTQIGRIPGYFEVLYFDPFYFYAIMFYWFRRHIGSGRSLSSKYVGLWSEQMWNSRLVDTVRKCCFVMCHQSLHTTRSFIHTKHSITLCSE